LLTSLGLTLLAVASAGPQWGQDWSQATAPGRDMVVALDVSRSMLAEQPSRLDRAIAALKDLSVSLRQHGGHRVALVVYAARTKILCPLTHDYDHFREVVEGLEGSQPSPEVLPNAEAASGTRIGAGILAALEVHDPDVHHHGYQDVLLISDGDDPARDGEWRNGLAAARARDIPVHAVGVGDPRHESEVPFPPGHPRHGSPGPLTKLEEEPLREIARLTGGVYVSARTQVLPLGRVFQELMVNRPLREFAADALPQYWQRYAWFFAGSLALVTMEMLLAGFRVRSRSQEDRSDEKQSLVKETP
jgi:Ca-activated chloride channel family protein